VLEEVAELVKEYHVRRNEHPYDIEISKEGWRLLSEGESPKEGAFGLKRIPVEDIHTLDDLNPG